MFVFSVSFVCLPVEIEHSESISAYLQMHAQALNKITCVSYSKEPTQVESPYRVEQCRYMLPPLHQQGIQIPLEDRLQWVVELWVVELCGKGMQLVGLDQQEIQILSLVDMLQMKVYIVAQSWSS